MLLSVQNLASYFYLDEGVLRAVDRVSFEIGENETVALVGESGCGKTIIALSILKLIPPPGKIVAGSVLLEGEDILSMSRDRLRQIRAKEIGIVFQEPGSALNPVYTVGHQIAEVLRLNRNLSRREADSTAINLLGDVGIPEPERRAKSYSFELSGGMRQRAAIAMATSAPPKLLIADEPTTALDVTVQAEILDLLRDLQQRYKMAILLITHDLAVVAEMAKRVIVMYTGKVMEVGNVEEIFEAPQHPYTKGLLASVLRLGSGRNSPLRGIPGSVPDFLSLPSGCTFHPRCSVGDHACTSEFPPLRQISSARMCACYKVETA